MSTGDDGTGGPPPPVVLCAGDQFIRAETLAAAVRERLPGAQIVQHATDWPDEPYRDIDGVRESAGDPAELAAAARGATVVVTHLAPVTEAVLAAAGNSLRLVASTRGGPVNIDVAAATRQGVPVSFLPGRNLAAVAEFTIGAMISLPRNVGPGSRKLAAGQWEGRYFRYDLCGPELSAATVGLVGYGAVGRRVAHLLAAFGATVLAHDPYADPAVVQADDVRLVELAELLAACDIVSVHARLTDDTRGMFGAEAFAAMKPGAYFVNTARGELVDEAALAAALGDGHLAGAALDVWSPEPPAADNPLLAMDPVLATPHLAGASRQVAELSAARVADAVAGYLTTGRIENCANPDVLRGAS